MADAWLAAELDELRRVAGLSYRELSRLSGLPRSTLNDALGGRRRPRLETVLAVVRACGGDAEDWRRRWVEARQEAGPAQPARPAVPAELPHDVGGFTGRAAELAVLESSAGGLCLIHGPPGVGKTALAVHWAHRTCGDRFPDGQLFVNLRGHHPRLDPMPAEEALGQILRSLGVPPNEVPIDHDEQAGLYRSLVSGKRMMILLDDAVDAAQVRPLLAGSPGCLTLITSRRHLAELVAYDGARQLPLDVLAPARATEVIVRIAGEERVRAEPAAAAEVAALCGHLPLALRIAAALLALDPTRTCADLAARLATGDRLDTLGLAGGSAEVRVAFLQSYRTLSAGDRRAFRLLGLVPGPDFGAEAVGALLGTSRQLAARRLEVLVDCHLVEHHQRGRYRLHDLLRSYAVERVTDEDEPGAREAALRRLLDWYVEVAGVVSSALYPGSVRLWANPRSPSGSQEQALAWLESEYRSLLAAIQHAARYGPATVAWELVDLLWVVFLRRMAVTDLLLSAEAGLAAAHRDREYVAAAAMHCCLGWAHWSTGRFDDARTHFADAVATYRAEQHAAAEATALGGLTAVCALSGQLDEALQHCTRALAIYRAAANHHGEAVMLNSLANVSMQLGRLDEAAAHFTESVELLRAEGNLGNVGIGLANLAHICNIKGLPGRALAHCADALTAARQVGDRYGEVCALINTAIAHRLCGRYGEALATGEAALAGAKEIGDRSFEATARDVLATTWRECGEPAEHGRVAEQRRLALRIARESGERALEADVLVSLAADRIAGASTGTITGAIAGTGSELIDPDADDEALDAARRALELARETGSRLTEADALTVLSAVHLWRGDTGEGHQLAAAATSLYTGMCVRLGEARARTVLGHALHLAGKRTAALDEWLSAQELFTAIGAPQAATIKDLLARNEPVSGAAVL